MSAFLSSTDGVAAGFLRPDSVLRRLASPAAWAEGPVWLPAEDAVVFSDVKGNRMFRWSRDGVVSVFRDPSNFANGNALDRDGRLVTCEHGRRGVSRTEPDGRVHMLVDRFDGRRLNSPNDVAVKSDGSIWFTDPPYGITGDAEGFRSESQVIGCWVYRFDPETGEVDAVATDVQRPNGLAFSPDERRLYVADMSVVDFPTKGRRHLAAYDVVDGRRLANPRVVAVVELGIPDGFTVDAAGNLYCSFEAGVMVIAPDGRRLGVIAVPERVSNCTFGGPDQDELFITATTSLYHIRLAARGVQYGHLLEGR
ncbi:SMP-30/gluconolactonase/LRE family protein [Pleomorphomonas carboxyditropha]|uniref:Gluconolactonase n=1 Tax=Pleomorphomonas carboxyditropha TaxID=2023338 RepID=A0A2G9X1N2_9HYPH|nr:SMP-30/gluconolactonase/LRE family protein [Pleomorphomonas carboxyditropha]PIP00868.1 gluconolactonase [Pleomorphomonas carboxyditropha]